MLNCSSNYLVVRWLFLICTEIFGALGWFEVIKFSWILVAYLSWVTVWSKERAICLRSRSSSLIQWSWCIYFYGGSHHNSWPWWSLLLLLEWLSSYIWALWLQQIISGDLWVNSCWWRWKTLLFNWFTTLLIQ